MCLVRTAGVGKQSKGHNVVCLTYDHDRSPSQQGKKCEEHDLVGIQEVLEEAGSICDQWKHNLRNATRSPFMSMCMHGQSVRWTA